MTKQEAARIVAVLQASYPGTASRMTTDQAADMIAVWADLFADTPYEHVNAAVRVLLRTTKFMPSVAEVAAQVAELTRGARLKAGEAWGWVVGAIGRWGAYRTPGVDFTIGDSTIARCVDAMGWVNLCLSENPVAERARFIELYDQLADDRRRADLAPELAATRERHAVTAGDAAGGVFKRLEAQWGKDPKRG